MATTLLNSLETLKTILEDQNSYWRYKVMVSYSSSKYPVSIETISRASYQKLSSRVNILSLMDRAFNNMNGDLHA